MQVASLTVLVVDAHAPSRMAISQALTYQPAIKLVATAQNYSVAEKLTAQLSPDIIWLDLNSGQPDGIAEIHRLKKLSAASRIMAITAKEDEQEAFAAILAGAQGYRSQASIDAVQLMSSIQVLCRDEFVFPPKLRKRLLQRLRAAALSGFEEVLGSPGAQ